MKIDDILENIPLHIRSDIEGLLRKYIQESKDLEEKLTTSEKRYRDLIFNLSEIVVEMDSQAKLTFVSPQVLDLLGYQPEKVVGKNGINYVHPDDQQHTMEALAKALEKKYISGFEYRARHKDGHYLWFSASGRVVEEDDNYKLLLIIRDISKQKQVKAEYSTGVTSTTLDITNRKKAEEEIERAKNDREQILNSLVEHVVYQDTQHRILWVNQAACDSVDKTLDQLVGKYCYQVWNQRNEPCINCPVEKALQTRKPQENEIITPDGRVWFIQGVPVFDGNGGITGMVETTLEITERKIAEEALRESKEKYQMLVEKLREGVLLEDSEGFISFVNPQTARMLGYSEDELIGKHYSFIVSEDDLEKTKTETSKRPKGISSTYEASLLTKDGCFIPVLISASPIFSNTGEFEGILSVATDITERIKAREEKEKLVKARKDFMDQAAHELRTPLTIIKGYTEFLKMRETNEENQKILNTIINNIIRLEELGTSVSDIYRIERGKFDVVLEEMDFRDFLINFLDPYLKLYEGQFHFDDHRIKDQVLIKGDSKRIQNVLSNVLDNAIRNTLPNTRKIHVDFIETKYNVELVIKDNGAGIKPENLTQIFEKFTSFPTKYDITGTGLGLYIAREIIDAHNGSISAFSKGEDTGTTIRIKLPRIHN